MVIPSLKNITWQKVWEAVDAVRDRLLRATSLLNDAGVPYAVIGGNAVATWVRTVDPSLIRTTTDVDILIDRADLGRVREALEPGGFIYRHAAGIDMFLDGPGAKIRDVVHVLFAEKKVRTDDELPSPAVSESERAEEFQVLMLEPLVRLKLTSFRTKDQVHIRDVIDAGLVDFTWPDRFPPVLAERLRGILATPDG